MKPEEEDELRLERHRRDEAEWQREMENAQWEQETEEQDMEIKERLRP
jgi:hypothetical protein